MNALKNIDWQLVKIFLGLCRAGSFAGAAEALGVDESTVRRRFSQLEDTLGASLFTRQGGRLQLREEQKPLLNIACDMEAKARHFFDETVNLSRSGTVRISLIDLLAAEMAAELCSFSRNNPDIVLNVTTEPHIVDLDSDEVDIAIRMARPTRGQHKLKSFGRVAFGIYGSNAYFDRMSSVASGGHDVIELGVNYPHFDHEFLLAEYQWMHELAELGDRRITVDSYPVMLRLCEQGCGLAVLPTFLARRSPNLRQLKDSGLDIQVDLWGVFRHEMSELPRVRKVIDFLDGAMRSLLSDLNGLA